MKIGMLLKTETNRTAYNRVARKLLRCDRCRPHRGENATNHKKHGTQKARGKGRS